MQFSCSIGLLAIACQQAYASTGLLSREAAPVPALKPAVRAIPTRASLQARSDHTYLPAARITPSWDDDDPSFGHQDGPVWTRIYSDLPVQTNGFTKVEFPDNKIPAECRKAKETDAIYAAKGKATNVRAWTVTFNDCPTVPLTVCYEIDPTAADPLKPVDDFIAMFTVVPPPLRAAWDIVAQFVPPSAGGCACNTGRRDVEGGYIFTWCAGSCSYDWTIPVALHEAGNGLALLGRELIGGAAGEWYDDADWIAAAKKDLGRVVNDETEYLADLFKEVVIFDVNYMSQKGGGLSWLANTYTPALQYTSISNQVEFMESTMFPGMLTPAAACTMQKLATSRVTPALTARTG